MARGLGEGKPLKYTAVVDFDQATKDAKAFQKVIEDMSKGGAKPMSEFQKAQLELQKRLKESRLEVERLKKEEQLLKNERVKSGVATAELSRKLAANRLEQSELTRATRLAREANKAASGSYRESSERLKQLGLDIRNAKNGMTSSNPVLRAQVREYNQLRDSLTRFDETMGIHTRKVGQYQNALSGLKGLAASYLGAAAILGTVKEVVNANAEISDSLSDVRRTAGLTAIEAENLAENLKKIDTRTSLKGLLDIATIGGQLGIAKDQLGGFTASVDQLAVSLSGELQGGAEGIAKSLGVLDNVFGVTKANAGDVEKSYNQIGSAILGLGQSGLATGDFLTDFGERVGGVAKQAGLSLPVILSYGAVLQENGVSAEVAGTSFKKLISLLATKNEKFFAIAKLADAKLTLNEFNDAINNDTKKALELFFAGLQKGGQKTTDYMAILKAAGLAQGGVSQSIAALSGHQAELNGHIEQATKDFDAATLSAEQFKIKNDNLAGSLEKFDNTVTKITTSGRITSLFKGIVDGANNALDKFNNLVNSESWKEFWTRLNTSNINGNDAINFNKAFERTSKANDSNQKFIFGSDGVFDEGKLKDSGLNTFNRNLERLKKNYDIALDAYAGYAAAVESGRLKEDKVTVRQYKANAERAKDYYQQLLDLQKKFGYAPKVAPTPPPAAKTSVDLSGVVGGNSKKGDGLDAQRTLQAEIDAIHANATKKQKTQDQQDIDALDTKYKVMRTKIQQFYADVNRKGNVNTSTLDKDYELEKAELVASQNVAIKKQEIEQQKVLFNEFEQYKADFGQAEAEKRFAADIKGYKSYVDYLKGLMPDEKDLSVQANKMRDLLGKTLLPGAEKDALKRQEDNYTQLLKSTATYQDLLASKTATFQADYDLLIKHGAIARAETLKQSFKQDVDLLITHENNKSDIARRLAKDAILLSRAQIKEQIADLENALKDVTIPENLKPRLQSGLSDLKVRLNVGADQVNLDTLKSRRVDVLAAIAMESKKAVPDVAALNNELSDLNFNIRKIDRNGDGKVSGLEKFLNKLETNKGLEDTAKWAGVAADGFNTMSQALGGVDTKAGYALDTIGQLAGGVADLATGLASGDPSKMIGAAIKAVGTLFSIGKKVKEMNAAARKEVADFYAQAITGEKEYQDMLQERQIQRVRDNKIVLQGIRDEIALRKSQQASFDKEYNETLAKIQGQQYITGETYRHGTWFRKAEVNKTYGSLKGMNFEQLSQLLAQGKLEGDAKTLVERLKELEQKGYDASEAMEDLARQTSEIFTGTTADNLTDSLLNMFKEGKTGVQDLANFFKDTMDTAALSIFKNKVLAQALENFYKQFDAAAQSGDELTDTEIASLQTAFNNVTADALKKFEDFKKITGSNLNGSTGPISGNSLISGVRNITEDTAQVLTGINNKQYCITKKTNNRCLHLS
ncbi:phage tail tape measure protein [Pedobacter sp. Leaf170]|uniref:phage tail tape measure protein n=1 Tax=Pedobacter sp. Leaf170 TaxID=2876558 RepID=UPI001E5DC44F|nr:phage tail tape measure protein [Pedobacter sp. Leaf170]